MGVQSHVARTVVSGSAGVTSKRRRPGSEGQEELHSVMQTWEPSDLLTEQRLPLSVENMRLWNRATSRAALLG